MGLWILTRETSEDDRKERTRGPREGKMNEKLKQQWDGRSGTACAGNIGREEEKGLCRRLTVDEGQRLCL